MFYGISQALPIIADERVDPEMGTGVLKITPAHDPADYVIAADHQLPMVDIYDDRGRANHRCGVYVVSLSIDAFRNCPLQI